MDLDGGSWVSHTPHHLQINALRWNASWSHSTALLRQEAPKPLPRHDHPPGSPADGRFDNEEVDTCRKTSGVDGYL